MLIELAVGPLVNSGDSTRTIARGGKQGDAIVSELHGKYYEQAVRANTFSLDSDTITLASTTVTKSAMGTAKFINGFYNPTDSGVNAVILSAVLGTVSVTTGGGPFFYNVLTGLTITSASTGTIRRRLVSGAAASKMTPQVFVALVASGAPTTALVQLAVMGGNMGAAVAIGTTQTDDVAGSIIVPPGAIFGLMSAGAGSSHVIQTTLTWEEVPTV
jgi:hypothetical protein